MCLLCLVNRVANNGFKPFEMLFKASRCDDLNLLKSFTGELSTVLKDTVRYDTHMLTYLDLFYSYLFVLKTLNLTGP